MHTKDQLLLKEYIKQDKVPEKYRGYFEAWAGETFSIDLLEYLDPVTEEEARRVSSCTYQSSDAHDVLDAGKWLAERGFLVGLTDQISCYFGGRGDIEKDLGKAVGLLVNFKYSPEQLESITKKYNHGWDHRIVMVQGAGIPIDPVEKTVSLNALLLDHLNCHGSSLEDLKQVIALFEKKDYSVPDTFESGVIEALEELAFDSRFKLKEQDYDVQGFFKFVEKMNQFLDLER